VHGDDPPGAIRTDVGFEEVHAASACDRGARCSLADGSLEGDPVLGCRWPRGSHHPCGGPACDGKQRERACHRGQGAASLDDQATL